MTGEPRGSGALSVGAESPTELLAALVADGPIDGRKGVSERVYEVVRTAIIRGVLPAGTVLAESELGRSLGISRTPVRSALQSLLAEDLVEIGARRQVIVRGVTHEQAREVLLLREALERVAVTEACAAMTIDEIDALRLILIRQRRAAAAGAVEDFVDLDDRFHLGIAEGARLPLVERFLSQIRAIIRVMGLRAIASAGRVDQVLEEHERIVEALESRDVEAALAAIEVHLRKTQETITSLDGDPVAVVA